MARVSEEIIAAMGGGIRNRQPHCRQVEVVRPTSGDDVYEFNHSLEHHRILILVEVAIREHRA